MKKLLFFLLIMLSTAWLRAQTDEKTACMDRTLRAFYAEYDGHLGPEPVRKAKFNDYIDCTDPDMPPAERDRAFRLVDAYIRGDGSGLLTEDKKRQLQATLQDLQKQFRRDSARAMKAIDGQMAHLRSMSYAEYASYLREMYPLMDDRQIALSYNRLHQADGKKVTVPAKRTGAMNPDQALKIVEHPERYDFARYFKAYLLLDPAADREEVRQFWQAAQKSSQ